jgi:hypothetical protein
MQSRAARLGVLAAVIVAAAVAFIVLQNDNSDDGDDGDSVTTAANGATTTTAANPVPLITVKDGEPVGGVQTLTFEEGDQVRFEVRLNRPEEEIHVHGYEEEASAETSPVLLSFPAKLDGIFEVEVHRQDGSEAQIAELRVNP